MRARPGAIVRLVDAQDRDALAEMMRALWPDEPRENFAGDVVELRAHVCVADPNALWVALNGVRPVGFLAASVRPHAEGDGGGPVAFVEGWFVHEAFRRQGLGRLLLAAAEDWGRSKGLTVIESDTERSNALSREAHGRLGFKETTELVRFSKPL